MGGWVESWQCERNLNLVTRRRPPKASPNTHRSPHTCCSTLFVLAVGFLNLSVYTASPIHSNNLGSLFYTQKIRDKRGLPLLLYTVHDNGGGDGS